MGEQLNNDRLLVISLHFRLVYDRETGKPKGYGFCEYKDTETAQSAMRNLNGTEIHGRQLRVDSAASQKGSEDPRGMYHGIPSRIPFSCFKGWFLLGASNS